MKNLKTFESFMLNELSPALFRSALDVTRERESINRMQNLGRTYLDSFIGSPVDFVIHENVAVTGVITDITSNAFGSEKLNQKNFQNIAITLTLESSLWNEKRSLTIYYNITDDVFQESSNYSLSRKTARLFSKIAEKVNPETKYKESGKYFKIIGH